jgi:hypothetical protein
VHCLVCLLGVGQHMLGRTWHGGCSIDAFCALYQATWRRACAAACLLRMLAAALPSAVCKYWVLSLA